MFIGDHALWNLVKLRQERHVERRQMLDNLPLLTELEVLAGAHYYKHDAPNGAVSGHCKRHNSTLVLPDEQPSPEQIAAYRRMAPERRLRLAEQLYWSARKMKAAWLRQQHPDWPDERINSEVRRIFLHART